MPGNSERMSRQTSMPLPSGNRASSSATSGLTARTRASAWAAVLAGASGYVLKEVRTASLVDAIRQVAQGRSLINPALIAQVMDRVRAGNTTDNRLAALSPREREVLDLIADGLTNRQIGERMYLAEKTVKNYVSSLLNKLGMQRRTQAAVFGAEVRNGG